MEPNPYEAPREAAEHRPSAPVRQPSEASGCVAVFASFIWFFVSGVISMLLKPLEMPKGGEALALIGLVIVGWAANWTLCPAGFGRG